MKSILIKLTLIALVIYSCNSTDKNANNSTSIKGEDDQISQDKNVTGSPFNDINYINEHFTIGKATSAHLANTSKSFIFFKTSFLIDIREKLTPVPAAIDHGNDWAGNREKVSVLKTKGKSIKIKINQKKGWTDRSMLRFFNPIIIDTKGHLIGDVFSNDISYNGSKPKYWFVEENGLAHLIIELKDLQKNTTSYFKALLNETALEFSKVEQIEIEDPILGTPIKELLTDRAWDNFVAETGAGKQNLQQKADGKFTLGNIFYPILDRNTPAVKIGEFIYVNYN